MTRSAFSGTGLASVALGVGLALAPVAAHAQRGGPHPLFLPTRDVAVTYRIGAGAGQPSETTHMYYTTADGGLLRIDTPSGAGFTVLERARNAQMLVISARRVFAAMTLPPGTANGFILNDTMTYVRQGRRTIAGYPCTEWTVTTPGTKGEACVTDDGVLLAGQGGQPGGPQTDLTATEVSYGPQNPSLFRPPAGFRQLSPQEMQQMMGPPNGAPPNGAPPNGAYPPPGGPR